MCRSLHQERSVILCRRKISLEEMSLFQPVVRRSQPQKNIVADVKKIQEIPSANADKLLLDQASAAQSFV